MLNALAAAVTAPHAFHEPGRGTTTVTLHLHKKLPDLSLTAVNLVYLLKGNIKGSVSVGCILRQTKSSSIILKETTPRTGFRGAVGVETLNSSSKHSSLLSSALPFNQSLY